MSAARRRLAVSGYKIALHRRDHVLGREAEMLEQRRRRRRFAEAVDADDRAARGPTYLRQ